ncbi:uncharacterized protein LOC121388131 isoform X2 [Gigantopelta aegis]|nr:uncharacterized protein LOC121388131 isoform X2 [Gigantopelta aegis]
MKTNINNLCVIIHVETTGDSFFMFLSLRSLAECVNLPLNTDLSSGSCKVYVYGLERTDTPYFYTVTVSGVRKLTKLGENLQWKLDLGTHDVAHMALIKSNDSEVLDPFAMTHKRVSPKKIQLNTEPSTLQPNVLVIMKQLSSELFWLTSPTKSSVEIPQEMMSSGTVMVKVYSLQRTHCSTGLKVYKKKTSSAEVEIKWPDTKEAPEKLPDMSIKKLKTLKEKAANYMSRKKHGMYIISHLYRNKPPAYFHNIMNLQDGIMETYRKDYNGDPACSINNAIDGLFFSTGLDRKTRQPPEFSFFGAKRLHVPAQWLLNDNTNMYFADFYCHYQNHYVCVVVAEKGSRTDIFCQSKLLQLDPYENPFICRKRHPILTEYQAVYVTVAVYVELFYTEDIDIGSMFKRYPSVVYFTRVTPVGRGKSKKYGIPKNKNCKICVL